MGDKVDPKRPLFVVLSWFAPPFFAFLVLVFNGMKRSFLVSSFSQAHSDLFSLVASIRPNLVGLEAASFAALMSTWIFALLYPYVAYRRKEKHWWLATPPFLFGLFILGTALMIFFLHDPKLGYHTLFSSPGNASQPAIVM